ncbi:hypothetical protein BDM02DRAFT_2341770 [Thelephora ganbajun]|uniref:Uncharacterized protein n=1 Tax=Thelephora ganbajun TaxID=370292 RepID=A0ACB6ZFD4_THEGA|nr:hypothetical protein BDM02DRAFT_2341770 [Thelephora ganbajun]
MERAQKRRKATKACDSCRRQKSRCEWNTTTDESPNGSCHRCSVLFQTCTIDGHPTSQNTHRVPTPGPSSASTSGTSRDDTPSVAGSSVQGRSLLRHLPGFHERFLSLENSEPFLTDLGKVAWSTPMAMLTKLMSWHNGRPSTSDTGKDAASVGILSGPEVQELLSVFEQKYEPWLGIEAPTLTSPFLISVRCLIAARHLPAYRRLAVIPPLHILCREHAMNFILSSTPNLASIQALHILSTWEPIESLTSVGQRMGAQNGGALIAATIAHASILRLDAAAEFVYCHPESNGLPEDVKFKAKMVRCDSPL